MLKKQENFFVSILIPTLNSALVLEKCLESIELQNYPKNKIEIIIADGGSTDETLKIAKKYKAKIFPNPLKTGEAGKAVALRHSQGELVALIDSDNILPEKDWLNKMLSPFEDPEIIASEPWEYVYRKDDGFIDRYCALMGMNDPYCYFAGNYDRINVLSGKWTGLKVKQKDFGGWVKVFLSGTDIPTVGANGTIFRQEFLESSEIGDYFFDIDIIGEKSQKELLKLAKVKTGIIHLFCGSSIKKFIRKQKRRVTDYLYYKNKGVRRYPWKKQSQSGTLKFVLMTLSLAPLFYQSIKGFLKKPDFAWFFHPLACFLTLWIYGTEIIFFNKKSMEITRKGWKQ